MQTRVGGALETKRQRITRFERFYALNGPSPNNPMVWVGGRGRRGVDPSIGKMDPTDVMMSSIFDFEERKDGDPMRSEVKEGLHIVPPKKEPEFLFPPITFPEKGKEPVPTPPVPAPAPPAPEPPAPPTPPPPPAPPEPAPEPISVVGQVGDAITDLKNNIDEIDIGHIAGSILNIVSNLGSTSPTPVSEDTTSESAASNEVNFEVSPPDADLTDKGDGFAEILPPYDLFNLRFNPDPASRLGSTSKGWLEIPQNHSILVPLPQHDQKEARARFSELASGPTHRQKVSFAKENPTNSEGVHSFEDSQGPTFIGSVPELGAEPPTPSLIRYLIKTGYFTPKKADSEGPSPKIHVSPIYLSEDGGAMIYADPITGRLHNTNVIEKPRLATKREIEIIKGYEDVYFPEEMRKMREEAKLPSSSNFFLEAVKHALPSFVHFALSEGYFRKGGGKGEKTEL